MCFGWFFIYRWLSSTEACLRNQMSPFVILTNWTVSTTVLLVWILPSSLIVRLDGGDLVVWSRRYPWHTALSSWCWCPVRLGRHQGFPRLQQTLLAGSFSWNEGQWLWDYSWCMLNLSLRLCRRTGVWPYSVLPIIAISVVTREPSWSWEETSSLDMIPYIKLVRSHL